MYIRRRRSRRRSWMILLLLLIDDKMQKSEQEHSCFSIITVLFISIVVYCFQLHTYFWEVTEQHTLLPVLVV